MYDFSVEQNDKVVVHKNRFNINTSFLSYFETADCWEYLIDSVKEVEISNTILKQQFISDDSFCDWGFYSSPHRKDIVIEKIGSLTSFFGRNGVWTLGQNIDESFLRCYEETSGFTFKNSNWNYPCDTIFSTNFTNKISSNTLNLSPNPATDFIRLELQTENNNIQILNSQGQVFYQEKSSEKILNINTQNFASGIYFVIVSNQNGKTSHGKFIKQ